MPTASLSVQIANLASQIFHNHIGVVILLAIVVIVIATSWITKVNASRSTLNNFIEEIRADIKKILADIPPRMMTSQSPIKLSELGSKIAEEIQIDTWVSEWAESLLERVKNKSPYEIQEFCFQYAQEEFPAELKKEPNSIYDQLELAAFQNGLQLTHILEVVGVVLRDKVLEHLAIGMEE